MCPTVELTVYNGTFNNIVLKTLSLIESYENSSMLYAFLSCMKKQPEAHGHKALQYIQLWHNRKLNIISVAMTTNQNQAFGQNLHGWKRTSPEISAVSGQ